MKICRVFAGKTGQETLIAEFALLEGDIAFCDVIEPGEECEREQKRIPLVSDKEKVLIMPKNATVTSMSWIES